jgi:hypothetical protein
MIDGSGRLEEKQACRGIEAVDASAIVFVNEPIEVEVGLGAEERQSEAVLPLHRPVTGAAVATELAEHRGDVTVELRHIIGRTGAIGPTERKDGKKRRNEEDADHRISEAARRRIRQEGEAVWREDSRCEEKFTRRGERVQRDSRFAWSEIPNLLASSLRLPAGAMACRRCAMLSGIPRDSLRTDRSHPESMRIDGILIVAGFHAFEVI